MIDLTAESRVLEAVAVLDEDASVCGTGCAGAELGEAHADESALLALAAVAEYARRVHAQSMPLNESVADLLTDLMHLVERSGQSFDTVLDGARLAYRLDLGLPAHPAP